MIWIILIIIGLAFYFYKFSQDRDKMLTKQVDDKGGMVNKYNELVEYLTISANGKIIEQRRDYLYIRVELQFGLFDFHITESFDSVKIKWVGRYAVFGEYTESWSFPDTYPQNDMLVKIEHFIEWKTNQVTGGI